ncbi:MAG: putative methyltransferase [Actinomycetia bacterium]|nr:putative methyltransferase [Actinomycetes bacterium]
MTRSSTLHGRRCATCFPSRGRDRPSTSAAAKAAAAGNCWPLATQVVGVDRSPTLAAAAVAASPSFPVPLADAAALPLADESACLVVACMSLLDIDDFAGAVSEIGRVLQADKTRG